MQESDKKHKNGPARFLQKLDRYPIIFFRLLYRSLVCQARLMDVFTKELYQMTEVSLLLRCWVDNLVTCEWSEWSYNGWISQGQPDLAPVSRTWDTHWLVTWHRIRNAPRACALLPGGSHLLSSRQTKFHGSKQEFIDLSAILRV